MPFSRSYIRILILLFFCCGQTASLFAAEANGDAISHFDVREYAIEGNSPIPTNALVPLLSRFTGTNVDMVQLVRAAAAVQTEYFNHDFPLMSVVISERRITNGVATLKQQSPGSVARISAAVASGSPMNGSRSSLMRRPRRRRRASAR